MSAHRYPDPREDVAEDWDDLSRESKLMCLTLALDQHPELIDKFYDEALSNGCDPFHYVSEI